MRTGGGYVECWVGQDWWGICKVLGQSGLVGDMWGVWLVRTGGGYVGSLVCLNW